MDKHFLGKAFVSFRYEATKEKVLKKYKHYGFIEKYLKSPFLKSLVYRDHIL